MLKNSDHDLCMGDYVKHDFVMRENYQTKLSHLFGLLLVRQSTKEDIEGNDESLKQELLDLQTLEATKKGEGERPN